MATERRIEPVGGGDGPRPENLERLVREFVAACELRDPLAAGAAIDRLEELGWTVRPRVVDDPPGKKETE